MPVTAYMVAAAKEIHPETPTSIVRQMLEAAMVAQTSTPFSQVVTYSRQAERRLDYLNDTQWVHFTACISSILAETSNTPSINAQHIGANGSHVAELGTDHLLFYTRVGESITVQGILDKETSAVMLTNSHVEWNEL